MTTIFLFQWVTFTIPGNRICWSVIVQLGIAEFANEQFKSSDWVPQQNQKMMDELRHFKTPYGTMGDLFDATDVEGVSKVFFEDMLFETWNHGRTILIGDGMRNTHFSRTQLHTLFACPPSRLRLKYRIRFFLLFPTISGTQGEDWKNE